MQKRTLLALLAVAPAVALAQMGGRRGGRGGDKGGTGSQVNYLESTLHEFEEDLKLTAAQQSPWAAYAGGIRALQQDIARERTPRASDSALNLSQRLDRASDVARDRLAAVEDIVESAKALLKALAPEQQAMADPRLANLIAMSFGGSVACAPAGRQQKPAPQTTPVPPPA